MSESVHNLMREMKLNRVSPEVANKLASTWIMVELLSEPGAEWTVKTLAQRLKLTEAQVREIWRSPEFAELQAEHGTKQIQRGFSIGVGRILAALQDPETALEDVFKAMRTFATVYKTVQEWAPRQDSTEGIERARDLVKRLRESEVPVRMLKVQMENEDVAESPAPLGACEQSDPGDPDQERDHPAEHEPKAGRVRGGDGGGSSGP